MLVLTRHANQSIMIGDEVVVTVLEIRGDQVRLGIRAPRRVDVHREEVFVALHRQNQSPPAPEAGLSPPAPEAGLSPPAPEARRRS